MAPFRSTRFLITYLLFVWSWLASGQPWQLDKPDAIWDLPQELMEVSGLTISDKDSTLIAVQDETGIIFGLEIAQGFVKWQINMAGKGDFEGVAMADDTLYLLRSDGRIYWITWPFVQSDTVGRFSVGTPKDVDMEGLCWDPTQRSLMIAVKDWPDQEHKGMKGWLNYYPDTEMLDTLIHGLDATMLLDKAQAFWPKSRSRKLARWINEKPGKFRIGPSGICKDPVTGLIYIVSHRGKVFLSFDQDGSFLDAWPLDENQFIQPEGLAISRSGTLFIANEGHENIPGRILVFNRKSQESMRHDE